MKKSKFKKRYVLGVGRPTGIGYYCGKHYIIGIPFNMVNSSGRFSLNRFFVQKQMPKYRLILECVK